MSQTFPPTEETRLVLPYPNPGPEALPPSSNWGGSALPFLALAVGLVLATAWWWKRGGFARKGVARARGDSPPSATEPVGLEERVVALSRRAREGLVARFGASWSARTTEELANTPELAENLGAEATEQLVGLLRLADQVKFGGPEALPAGVDPLVQRVKEAIPGWLEALAAGPTSRISGK